MALALHTHIPVSEWEREDMTTVLTAMDLLGWLDNGDKAWEVVLDEQHGAD